MQNIKLFFLFGNDRENEKRRMREGNEEGKNPIYNYKQRKKRKERVRGGNCKKNNNNNIKIQSPT